MCGGQKFEFNKDFSGMFTVDARIAVNMPDLERGRVLVFVTCKESSNYILFKSEIDGIL
jgi:hypothetical protein